MEAVITNHQQSSASGQIEFTEAHPTEAILTGEIARPTELGGKVFLILKVSDQSLPKAVHVARIDATIGEERIDSMSLSESAADQLIFRFPLEHPPTPGNHGFFANVLFYSSEFRDGSVLVAKRRCLFCQSPKGESK